MVCHIILGGTAAPCIITCIENPGLRSSDQLASPAAKQEITLLPSNHLQTLGFRHSSPIRIHIIFDLLVGLPQLCPRLQTSLRFGEGTTLPAGPLPCAVEAHVHSSEREPFACVGSCCAATPSRLRHSMLPEAACRIE